MTDKDATDEFKTCVFYGTMASIFMSGAALTLDNSITQAIGTAMVFWVLGFFGALTALCPARDEAEAATGDE